MKEQLAKQVRDELLAVCKKHGVWVSDTYKREPDLKAIKLEVSIKVEGK